MKNEDIQDEEMKEKFISTIILIIMGVALWFYLSPSEAEKNRDRELSELESNLSKIMYVYKDKVIYRKDYGNKWAFNTDKITISCERYPIIYFTYDGSNKKYALNGRTQREYTKLERDNPLWLKEGNGYNVSLSPFTEEAIALCDQERLYKKFKDTEKRIEELKAKEF